jgi:PAS domain S-box-containing protein
MRGTEFQFACLNDPQLAEHALSPSPVWLWRADAMRILWANPVAAAIFDAPSPAAVCGLQFDPHHPAAAQIARLSGTLPQGGAPRLERLRGFGARFGGTLICLCSRIAISDNEAAVLVVSTERAGKDLSLPERTRRLLADFEPPAAIFSADGEFIDGQPAARKRLGRNHDLVALGAEKLAREATRNGRAEGEIAAGHVTMLRLGAGTTFTLMMSFGGAAQQASISASARDVPPPASTNPARSVPNPAAAPVHPRRSPFRFVWHMDAATRFTLESEEFTQLIGPQTAAALDRPWSEIAAALTLDPDGHVAQALASRDTWSGVVVQWPVDGENERLAVEMSGLPVFNRDRQFDGYRGFGICRDLDRLAAIGRHWAQSPTATKPEESKPEEHTAEVLPFPAAPTLSASEHSAFQQLAHELTERLKKTSGKSGSGDVPDDSGPEIAPPPASAPPRAARNGDAGRDTHEGRPILDRLPVGILVYRLNSLIYANRAFLDWTGYSELGALAEAGGLDSLFIETKIEPTPGEPANGAKTLTIATVNGKQKPVEGRLFSVAWNNENALVLMISTHDAGERHSSTAEASLRRLEAENRELKSILDTATDGVLVLDRAGRILSANRSAEALFGYEAAEFTEMDFGDLFAPESRRAALDDLDRLALGRGTGALDAGREAIAMVRQGGLLPLYVTTGQLADGDNFCAVFRDITAWKRTEEELINARQTAEKASAAKSEFLAKISHEIRTPLNAIIGFSEVMMDERFGPIGNERYRQYLKDIHSSGGHLISLLNDLLDLSKIEAGKIELTFVSVNLNDIVQQCVAIMQQQANRERVIIRTALHFNLPQIVADARSVRQIALNLLSNSIKFTGAGGQVIVSTTITDDQEVSLRVRDTGAGMSEKDLQTALEPFRQLATSARLGSSGTGLGLPITKALAEANHARFRISSQINNGTLVEVAFPATRALTQ